MCTSFIEKKTKKITLLREFETMTIVILGIFNTNLHLFQNIEPKYMTGCYVTIATQPAISSLKEFTHSKSHKEFQTLGRLFVFYHKKIVSYLVTKQILNDMAPAIQSRYISNGHFFFGAVIISLWVKTVYKNRQVYKNFDCIKGISA